MYESSNESALTDAFTLGAPSSERDFLVHLQQSNRPAPGHPGRPVRTVYKLFCPPPQKPIFWFPKTDFLRSQVTGCWPPNKVFLAAQQYFSGCPAIFLGVSRNKFLGGLQKQTWRARNKVLNNDQFVKVSAATLHSCLYVPRACPLPPPPSPLLVVAAARRATVRHAAMASSLRLWFRVLCSLSSVASRLTTRNSQGSPFLPLPFELMVEPCTAIDERAASPKSLERDLAPLSQGSLARGPRRVPTSDHQIERGKTRRTTTSRPRSQERT